MGHDHRKPYSCPVVGCVHRYVEPEGTVNDITEFNKKLVVIGPDYYSVAKAARMFRTSPKRIKKRALDGEIPYETNAAGRMIFPKQALLDHLDELIRKNNRI